MHELSIPVDVYGRAERALRAQSTAALVALAGDDAPLAAEQLLEAARADASLRSTVFADLRRVTSQVRERAEAELRRIERTSSIVAAVLPDGSGVGRCARVYYEATGRDTPRRADEGGDMHGGGTYPHEAAAAEAEERAQRVAHGRGIVRKGYALADVEALRARVAQLGHEAP